MSQAEGWILAVWAFGFIGSFVFWFRISREIPAAERNDPFMVCVFWPVVMICLAGLMLWVIATDDGRRLRHNRKLARVIGPTIAPCSELREQQ